MTTASSIINAMTSRTTMLQLLRFVATGVLNTGVTLLVIYLCKGVLGVNLWWSNFAGYVAGVVNSFFWQRAWVFRSRGGRMGRQAVRFLMGFAVCYLLQLATVRTLTATVLPETWLLPVTSQFTISGYGVATLIGMVVYTLCNFLYNRLYAFR